MYQTACVRLLLSAEGAGVNEEMQSFEQDAEASYVFSSNQTLGHRYGFLQK